MTLSEQAAAHMILLERTNMYDSVGAGGCARLCCIGRSWLVSYKTRRKEDEMDDRVGHSRFGILLQKIIRGI